jgi:hypothetical protein
VTLGDADFRKSLMKMIYRKFPKTASLSATCHPALPAVGVKISAKDATSEINLTKHFVAQEGSQRERAYAKRIFRKNYLKGVRLRQRSAQSHQKGAASAPTRRVLRRAHHPAHRTLTLPKILIKTIPLWTGSVGLWRGSASKTQSRATSHHTRRRGPTDMGHLMDYCKFLQTQDEAIEHCRLVNRGLSPTDPDCCAVVAGPGDNFAVVDLETAKDLLDEGNNGVTCLIVTG